MPEARRRALSVCICTSCPAHQRRCTAPCSGPYCPPCASQYERRRGTRQARGYDAHHDRLKEWWRPRVEAGLVDCMAPVCVSPTGRRIEPGTPWDLGHGDRDARGQRRHRGPEHAVCNRHAGGKAAHQ